MSEQDIGDLVDFGLTPLQSKVYVAVLRLGPCRAGRLSVTISLVRPEVYRILRELSSKGLVQRNPGAPTSYTATIPTRAVSLLLDRHKKRFELLKRKKAPLVKSLATQAPSLDERTPTRFSLITGGANLLFRERQMILDAKDEYVAIVSKDALGRMPDDIVAPALISARRRKLRMRVISEVNDFNTAGADSLSRLVELRRSKGLSLYVDIIDRKEMLFGPAVSDEEATDKRPREADVWTNNPRFIAGMHGLFETLWNTSRAYVPRKKKPARGQLD